MNLQLGEDVVIHPSARITAKDCIIGDRSIIREDVIIEGTYVQIGRESFLNTRSHIGGGSCNDPGSRLLAGDFFHMGVDSHINIARKVDIGYEVGIGIGTKIFTHGAYLSAYDGFPVQWGNVAIGNNVWLPHAWVNPGVVIGDNVVVSAMSLVNRNLPSGCLAGGIPVKILKENVYPNTDIDWNEFITDIYEAVTDIIGDPLVHICEPYVKIASGNIIKIQTPYSSVMGNTYFDIENRIIIGPVTEWTRVLKNQLRRNGIRFRYKEKNGEYVPW